MTENKNGKYASKHPASVHVDETMAREVKNRLENGHLSCATAHHLAAKLGCSVADIGRTADLMEVGIDGCFFGLFGAKGPDSQKLKLPPMPVVADSLAQSIREKLQDGRLPCLAGFEIADQTHLPRIELSRACEALGIKISKCQLGAF